MTAELNHKRYSCHECREDAEHVMSDRASQAVRGLYDAHLRECRDCRKMPPRWRYSGPFGETSATRSGRRCRVGAESSPWVWSVISCLRSFAWRRAGAYHTAAVPPPGACRDAAQDAVERPPDPALPAAANGAREGDQLSSWRVSSRMSESSSGSSARSFSIWRTAWITVV